MEIEQTRDTIVRKLTVISGEELEIMANLTNEHQVNMILEGIVDRELGDMVGVAEMEALLRASVSKGGRGREDLTTLGKAPDRGWKEGDQR